MGMAFDKAWGGLGTRLGEGWGQGLGGAGDNPSKQVERSDIPDERSESGSLGEGCWQGLVGRPVSRAHAVLLP